MIVLKNFVRIFIFYIVFLVYSINYLEKTFLVIWIKSYFTPYHHLIFLFYKLSRNFQTVCLTFSCSLESFPHFLLSVLSYLFSFPLCCLNTSCPCSLLPEDYRSAISIELTLVPNEISLSRSPGFSRNAIQPTQPVCRAYFQTKSLRQMRQKILYGRRARRL